jgi:hypothetical protein
MGLSAVACERAARAESPDPSTSATDPSPSAIDPPPPPRREWYGLPIIATDAGAAAMAVTGAALAGDTNNPNGTKAAGDAILFAGVTLYVLGGPIVHFARGNIARGFVSLGMRTAGPFLVGLLSAGVLGGIGAATCSHDDSGGYISCPDAAAIVGFGLGFLAGVGAASIVDITYVARDTVAPPPPPPLTGLASIRPSTRIVIDKAQHRTPTLGLVGRF